MIKLTKDHLILAQKLANKVWNNYSNEFGYRDSKKEKNNSVSTANLDNIYFFLGQFDIRNQQRVYGLARNLGVYDKKRGKPNKVASELANWIKETYLDEFLKDLK